MKIRKSVRRIITCVIAVVAACSAFIPFYGINENVYSENVLITAIVPTTEKITRDQDVSSYLSDKIYIEGAKGETESGQFIVNYSADITSYDISLSDFTGASGRISAENVEICKQVYTFCKKNIAHPGVLGEGYFPDALIPIEYIKAENEDTVAAGENQGFWLNVCIPTEVAAGEYTATLTFTYNKTEKQELQVVLNVFDFEIDAVPHFSSSFSVWEDWLYYGELSNNLETHVNYYDFLLKYNVDGGMFPNETPEQFLEYLRKYYDKVPSYRLPYRTLSQTENDWEYMERCLRLIIDACLNDEKNYFDKAYWRLSSFYDEYQIVSWRKPLVRPMIERTVELQENIINSYKNAGKLSDDSEIVIAIRNLRHHMTATYDESLSDLKTIVCPLYNKLWYTQSIDDMREHQEDGAVFWSYGCVESDFYPSPAWEINDYALSQRNLLWFDYENGVEGNLFWNVNGYCNWSKTTRWGYAVLSDLYELASHDGLSDGDGYLLYPGAPYGSEYPFASLRLAVYRDGVDDHTYMSMLAEKYKNMTCYGADYNITDVKSLVSFLNRQSVGRNASKLDYTAVFDARKTLAEAIEMADKNNVAVDTLEYDGNNINYCLYAPQNIPITVNGKSVAGVISGNGYRYAGTEEINAEGQFIIGVGGENAGSITVKTLPQAEFISEFDEDKIYLPALSGSADTAETTDNGVKVTLYGRNDSAAIIKNYTPKFGFDLVKCGINLKGISAIEFVLYNSSDKDIWLNIGFEKADGAFISYDELTIAANTSRNIAVDNFAVFGNIDISEYYKLVFKLKNLLDANNEPVSVNIYADNLLIRKK